MLRAFMSQVLLAMLAEEHARRLVKPALQMSSALAQRADP